MEDNLDYKKACKELLNEADKSFIQGAESMLRYLQESATNCNGKDNCLICESGRRYLKIIKSSYGVNNG